MTAATIAERVAAGAAFLDERDPGWDQRIDLDLLDLQTPCRCVLGQLATDLQIWYEIRERYGLDYEPGNGLPTDAELGFNAAGYQTDRKYANLTAAWKRLIAARRAGESR